MVQRHMEFVAVKLSSEDYRHNSDAVLNAILNGVETRSLSETLLDALFMIASGKPTC